jgi:hypothetical protein
VGNNERRTGGGERRKVWRERERERERGREREREKERKKREREKEEKERKGGEGTSPSFFLPMPSFNSFAIVFFVDISRRCQSRWLIHGSSSIFSTFFTGGSGLRM